MTSERQPWYVTERAMALAGLLLTSRPDVVVQHSRSENGSIDILAEVIEDGKQVGRYFGVQVTGRVQLPRVQELDQALRGNRHYLAKVTFPFCLFVLDVTRKEGRYRWLVEPTVDNGEPRLDCPDDQEWKVLDEQAVNGIVDQVSAWYDALAAQLRR